MSRRSWPPVLAGSRPTPGRNERPDSVANQRSGEKNNRRQLQVHEMQSPLMTTDIEIRSNPTIQSGRTGQVPKRTSGNHLPWVVLPAGIGPIGKRPPIEA